MTSTCVGRAIVDRLLADGARVEVRSIVLPVDGGRSAHGQDSEAT